MTHLTPRQFQQKYAWDLAQLGNALKILQKIGNDYNLFFGKTMFDSYHEACKKDLKSRYEKLKPKSTYVRNRTRK